MNIRTNRAKILLFPMIFITPCASQAQFLDAFDSNEITGWSFFTGDGAATVDFVPMDGYARILVDATADRHNVWWAIIKREVSASLELEKLADPDHELRVEARVRVSDTPRRLNFMVNTQRTTDFHEHLQEYDIPDTTGWHTISMTTRNLDAVPGDALNVQLGVTDWGLDKYHVDVDYYRADIVNVHQAGPDKGEPLPYHPPVPDTGAFPHKLDVTHDALINAGFPGVNFNDWHIQTQERDVPILTVGTGQWAVLRWDFSRYAKAKADGAGLLELTTHSVIKGGDYTAVYGEDFGMEFGKVRVIEIIRGDPDWKQDKVTYNSLTRGNPLSDVFNGQMIFDAEPSEAPGSKTYITISRPILQRLLDGKTKGLVIKPLGAIDASFYASESREADLRPKLYFRTRD